LLDEVPAIAVPLPPVDALPPLPASLLLPALGVSSPSEWFGMSSTC
jgi:hypothetical protein